jgi:hypothetical protein
VYTFIFKGGSKLKNPRGQERSGTSRSQFCKGDDRAEYIESKKIDDLKTIAPYENINKNNSNCECGESRSNPINTHPTPPPTHPIVNLCEPYIETIFFQYDSFPMTDNNMTWHNDGRGRIIGFTYYLDSSAGDSVTTYLEKISPSGAVENLLQTPANGNNYIKGTFNSTVLEFKLNMIIKNDDMIRVRFINNSASDVTIMAKMDIKYREEDFKGGN